jgi:Flp pilus assembly protein TadG
MNGVMGRLRREDDGVATVLVVLVMVGILIPLAAIGVDIAGAYANRRQMQNAADAGALAGANVISKALYTSTTPNIGVAATLDSVVRSVVTSNGGDGSGSNFSCRVINTGVNEIGGCADTASWAHAGSGAVGVRVTAGSATQSVFAGIFGTDKLTAKTVAAARVQPLLAGSGPFLVCYDNQKAGGNGGTDLPDILLSDNAPYPGNPAAIGVNYLIHGAQISDCGLDDSSFKGLADDPQDPFTLPGWVQTDTGDKAGPIRVLVAGQSRCTDPDQVGCVAVLPVCTKAQGQAHNAKMYCVSWGAFEITQASANSHRGRFLGTVTVAGGQGGNGLPQFGKPSLVKLVE